MVFEEEVSGIPFWDDLFSVTTKVPPWGLFSLLAQHPDIMVKVQIPLTYLLVPNENLTAKLCTDEKDGTLLIRRHTRETPVSFDMMEESLLRIFEVRGSDGQPFVCVIWAKDDWKPRFVSKEHFNLLCLFLRVSSGQNVSSYSREEQLFAATLFPDGITAVQAYVPLESDVRYVSVSLRSPVRLLSEVYSGTYYQDPNLASMLHAPRERGEKEMFIPLERTEPPVEKVIKKTAGVLASLRKQKQILIPGIVCEFLRDIHDNLYLTSVIRVSNPEKKLFAGELENWRNPLHQVIRVPPAIRAQAKDFHLKRKQEREEKADFKSNAQAEQIRSSPKNQKSVPAVPSLKLEKMKDEKSSVKSMTGRLQAKKPLNLSVNVNAEVIPFVPEMTPATASKRKPLPPPMSTSGGAEEEQAAPPTTGLKTARRKMGLSIDTARADAAPESPNGDKAGEEEENKVRERKIKDFSSSTEEIEKPLHELLLERSQKLYEQGEYFEALTSAREAEQAAIDQASKQKPGRTRPGNAECYRCGDLVHAEVDKQGYSHHEWRMKHSMKMAKENAKKSEAKRKALSRHGRTAQLDQFLTKLETAADKTREALPEPISENWQQTMCPICLGEVEKESWNRHLVRNIRNYRRGGT